MERILAVRALIWIAALVGVSCLPACNLFSGLSEGPTGFTLSDAVLLRLDNQSGIAATVDVTYTLQGEVTRTTKRQLPASGGDATQEVLWTQADLISITARAAEEVATVRQIKLGDILATAEYRLGIDYQAGGTIKFTLLPPEPGPQPMPDCNQNGIADELDLSSGTSADCNGNGIPDECDIANDSGLDQNGNLLLDACEMQACCLPSGSCLSLTSSDCTSQGGTAMGLGTDCIERACPQPTEACCTSTGACYDLPPYDCYIYYAGQSQGPGSTCNTSSCGRLAV